MAPKNMTAESSSLKYDSDSGQEAGYNHAKNRGVTGLYNLGNTCYMNAVLQCLCSTTPLVEYFLSGSYQTALVRGKGDLANTFANLMETMWFGDFNYVSPEAFQLAISNLHPPFGRKIQHDAQELLIYVLNGLHEETGKSRKRRNSGRKESSSLLHCCSESSVITHLLQGQLRYEITCLTCQSPTFKTEAFTVLSLPIPSRIHCYLEECLHNFFQQDTLTWGNKMHCSFCETKQDTSVKAYISSAPKIIILHLKRFEYEGQYKRKLRTDVTFPVNNLDFTPFLSPSLQRCPRYHLYAVVNHFGDLDWGHYTAYCKNPVTQRWYTFDDTRFFNIPESTVQTSNAYMLFYTCQPFNVPTCSPPL
ncbi:putative ubiquitin carboxyl-terminal hydrolase 50 isoform X1 [Rhinatrema bivittatum]|uniref:inactive ubiquitin carboxyl-terminal hydrolase 50 isoform X1 n=1 Tax=Rhinatrema bivittatum TaxID=194408 RepID=UPI0011260334|nr:inactive ubiquitin carboxyl-terminal hydrolase 50 isoform X1 [Rhinatrema bivittatum]XP_029442444.1 putative ubiquitin carboxyl-terminal hydrolase 50 isoform X1 [Rhinatrema bivittatum]